MNETHNFARNYIFLLVSRAIMVGGNAFVLLMIGWWLSVEDFGRFAFALSLAGLLSIIVAMGIDQWAIAYLPRQREQAPSFAGRAFTLRAVLIIPFLAVLTGVCLFSGFGWEQSVLVTCLGFAVGVQVNSQLSISLCLALERNELGVRINLVRSVSTVLAICVWALALRGSVVWLAVLWAASQIPAWLTGIYIIDRKACGINWGAGIKPWWKIIKNAYIFSLVSLVIVSNGQFETILLKYLTTNDTQVGYFQMAIRLILLAALPAQTLCDSFRPVISRRFGESRELFVRSVFLYHKSQFLLAVAILSFVAVFSKDILFLLFADKYLTAAPALRIMAVAWIIIYMPPSWVVLHVTGLQKYSFYILLVQTCLTIAVNCVVLQWYGIIGVAWVMVGSACVTRLLTLYFFRHVKYPIMDSRKGYVMGILAGFVALLVSLAAKALVGIIGAGLVFLVVFCVTSYRVVLTSEEKGMVKDAWHRIYAKLTGA